MGQFLLLLSVTFRLVPIWVQNLNLTSYKAMFVTTAFPVKAPLCNGLQMVYFLMFVADWLTCLLSTILDP